MADGKLTANSKTAPVRPMEEPSHLEPLLKRIKIIHHTHEHSDLIIKCKDREWKVHKLIVCSHSDPIDAAIRSFKEGEDGVYSMEEQDPQVVEALIHYLYNFDYSVEEGSQDAVGSMVFDVRMSIIADEYLITPLKTLAAQKFKKRCAKGWASPEFPKAVSELYKNGSDTNKLKKVAVDTIKAHARDIFNEERALEFEALFQIFGSTELGIDVSRALAGRADRTYKCPSTCQGLFTAFASGNCLINCPRGCYAKGATPVWWAQFAVTDRK